MTFRDGARRYGSSVVIVVALAIAAIVFRRELTRWFSAEEEPAIEPSSTGSAAPSASESSSTEIDHYTCPMHPSVKKHEPGKCPICGMDLVPVTKAEQREGVVVIDDAKRQLIGVTTAPVTVAPMQGSLRAIGRVAYDESSLTDVNLKVRGWITKLFVNETGQKVARGQPLFLVYSPELYNAQQDFLLATQGADLGVPGPDGKPSRLELLGRAARQRLRLLGLEEGQIDAIQKKGAPLESMSIGSPASGFVIEKNVVEGASFEAGTRLFRIAALGKVWVEADVYERDLGHVRAGTPARVTLDYLPGRAYDAKVTYVYPYVDSTARTGRIRLEIANKELELKPGMYARVEFESDRGPRLQVPVSAVVYTGPRRLVFRDLGQGRFRPQEVVIGGEADGMYEVLSGLQPGDVVATSGVFLIAAEARISTATKYWDTVAPAASMAPPIESPAAPSVAPPRSTSPDRPSNSRATKSGMQDQVTIYTCPMHPEVRSPSPGKCPICGMDLVPLPKEPPK